MNKRQFGWTKLMMLIGAALAMASIGSEVLAQARPAAAPSGAPFQIKNIIKDMKNAPNYGGAGAGDLGGGRPATIARQWLMLQVHFSSTPTWADDVKIKYYVLMGKDRDMKLFTGEVTHINVARGTDHYSVMFMHPNTVARYGAGKVQAVAAVLFYENRPISMISEPVSNKRWWEDYTPTPGYLLNQLETPWSVIAPERFEALKSTSAQ
jgi:hypothetical protein